MKKTYLLVAAILFAINFSYGQWTTSGTNIYNSNTGNVGIGTTSPNQLLDVAGTGVAINTTSKVNSIFTQDHTNLRGVYLGYDNSGQIGIIAGSTLGAPSNLAFWNYNGTSWFEGMRLTSAGYLGIGTKTPYQKLDLNGGSIAMGNINAAGAITFRNDVAVGTLGSVGISAIDAASNGNNDGLGLNVSDGLKILNGSNTYFTLLAATGNVGIGTTTPAAKLHVNGVTIVSGLTSNLDPARQAVNPNILANSGQLLIGWNRTATSGETDFIANQGLGTTGGFAFYNHDNNNNETQLMGILGNGNVGIGTTNPSDKLVVSGNIRAILDPSSFSSQNTSGIVSLGYSGITGARNWAIRGVYQYTNGVGLNSAGGDIDLIKSQDGNTILGTKTDGTPLGNVIIGKTTQMNNAYVLDVYGSARANAITVNTSGADFVFEPAYYLNSLSFVENYINKNHHLPEIPSAKQMQANGLNLGDNQVKLLQKIEELTLYLIEENKKNKEQEEVNLKQQVQLKAQQNQIDELNRKVDMLLNKISK